MAKPSESKSRILIVDDDAELAEMLTRSLTRRNYHVEFTAVADEALAWVEEKKIDAALLDLVMPDQDGMALAGRLRERCASLPIAILTGYTNSPLLESAARARIHVFKKPIEIQDIVGFLEAELNRGESGTRRPERLRS